jgi:hypothetical protein
MCLAEERPFLREKELPLFIIFSWKYVELMPNVENVLNDAGFLIIGFLDEERIVLNALGRSLVSFLGGKGG